MPILHGKIPRSIKLARVTPIFKGGNPEELGNYRSNSILSVVSKLLECAMANRILHFLNDLHSRPQETVKCQQQK